MYRNSSNNNSSKPVIFVVISVLVGALAYSSISAFNVFAVPNEAPPDADCDELGTFSNIITCCWTETDPNDPEGIELNYCQTCSTNGCNDKVPDPRGPTPPPSGPLVPPHLASPLQDGGVLQQSPTDETTQPPAEPLTDCPEGQVLDEETGLCVFDEPEVAEEPEQSEPEENGSEENGNDDN